MAARKILEQSRRHSKPKIRSRSSIGRKLNRYIRRITSQTRNTPAVDTVGNLHNPWQIAGGDLLQVPGESKIGKYKQE